MHVHASAPARSAGNAPARLDYLDGMRGLAALAVVVLHAFEMYGLSLDFGGPPQAGLGDSWLDRLILTAFFQVFKWGFFAVQVFIVLSGFSLMLPVVRSASRTIKGGLLTFVKRRAWRIIPPYYAALALSLLLISSVSALNTTSGVYWDQALPALQADTIMAHLLLVHNVPLSDRPYFGASINPPLWSIAVEWQIYFVFPLLVLAWRRLGGGAALALSFAIGVLPPILGLIGVPFSNGHYLVLFTLGMLGASVGFAKSEAEVALLQRVPWLWLVPGFGALFVGASFVDAFPAMHAASVVAKDLCLGAAVTCLLITMSRAKHNQARSLFLRIFELPALVSVGHFSYTLYLIHAPILALAAVMLRPFSPTIAHSLVLAVGIPMTVMLAALLYRFIERPFLRTGDRSVVTTTPALQK